jgi:hypothetical protein
LQPECSEALLIILRRGVACRQRTQDNNDDGNNPRHEAHSLVSRMIISHSLFLFASMTRNVSYV